MKKPSDPVNEPLERITSLFRRKKKPTKEVRKLSSPVMRLNFFLAHTLLEKERQRKGEKPSPLPKLKILEKQGAKLAELIEHAQSACSRQDIELFFYKKSYSQHHFAPHQAVQWKLLEYIAAKRNDLALFYAAKKSSAENLKRRLITFLQDETPASLSRRGEYSRWPSRSDPSLRVPPI